VKDVLYKNLETQIVVGPNPFTTSLNVSNMRGVKRLDIIDGSGRTVVSKIVTNQTTIRLDALQLPAGVYHLRVMRSNGAFTFVKVVKM
jgi:hypothetical protein